MNPFDEKAATWDDNPGRRALARAAFEAMSRAVTWDQTWRVLDAGAGTGLLTLAVLPHVARVTAVDNSAGMLEVLARKAANLPVDTHLCPLEALDLPAASFDAVISSMALHHVRDTAAALAGFARVLRPAVGPRPGGHLLLADLDLEDGSFHSDHVGVHHPGFDRASLAAALAAAGFTGVSFTTAWEMPRVRPDGTTRHFPVFLAHATV